MVTYTSTSYQLDTFLFQSEWPNATSMENNPNLTFFNNGAWENLVSLPVIVYDELYLTVDRWANGTNGITYNATELSSLTIEYHLDEDPTEFLVIGADGEYWLNFTNVYPNYEAPADGGGLKHKLAHVVHGHARSAPLRNRLQLSLSFLTVVILSNAVKLIVMLWVLVSMKDSDFVVTLGDAAASFIQRRDPTTETFCVFSKEAVLSEVAHHGTRRPEQQGFESVELSAYHGSKLNHLEDLLLTQEIGFQDLRTSAARTLEDDLGRNSSAVWRVRRIPFSSSLGKDMGIGSFFMCVPRYISVVRGMLIRVGLSSYLPL